MPARFHQRFVRPAYLLLLCAATFAVAAEARSQATVAVNWLADMSFGEVAAGTATSVSYSDAGASVFRVDVSNMAGFQVVVISFALPTQIVNGGDTVPISFGASDAAWSYTNDPSVAIAFDPNGSASVPKDGNLFSIYVWVGATVDPDGATTTQLYSNTFTLDAEIQ